MGDIAEETERPKWSPSRQRTYLLCAALVSLVALEIGSALTRDQLRSSTSVPWKSAPAAGGPEAPVRQLAGGTDSACAPPPSKAFEPIVFFLIAYTISAGAQQIEMLMPRILRVPHSVGLFLGGLALGRVGEWVPNTEFGRTVADFETVDPHIIFWVLLPALLYEDASSVKWHVMKKVLPSALLLAVPGVILNALLTGAIIKGVFGTIDWTWDAAFLLGTILSATDPVAVVGALHELAAPDRLSLLISGESLFNDGSAVVIFGLFWDSVRGIREVTPGYSIGFFLRLGCGGPLLGFVMALLAYLWLKQTRTFSIEILVLLVSVYGSFFVAEHPQVKVSGVLAVVVFGFFMAARGHFALNIDEMHRHHAVVKFLALLSNEAIFVLGGVVSFRVLLQGYNGKSDFGVRDFLELPLLYVIIHGTRAIIVLVCFPLLRNSGYGLTCREAVIVVFGGLRGAVGLALALMVEYDTRLDERTRSRIAFHTAGIVLFTLLINGTMITVVYKKLSICKKAQHHEKLLYMALMKADALVHRRGAMFEQHWFFHNCCFAELWDGVPNLTEAAKHLECEKSAQHDRLSEPTAAKTHLPVNQVMSNVARRLGVQGEEALKEHYMQKIRFRRRWARSAANVFLPANINKADEDEHNQHEVIELALQLSQNEGTKLGTVVSSSSDVEMTGLKPKASVAWGETPSGHLKVESVGANDRADEKLAMDDEDEIIELSPAIPCNKSVPQPWGTPPTMVRASHRSRTLPDGAARVPHDLAENEQRALLLELRKNSRTRTQKEARHGPLIERRHSSASESKLKRLLKHTGPARDGDPQPRQHFWVQPEDDRAPSQHHTSVQAQRFDEIFTMSGVGSVALGCMLAREQRTARETIDVRTRSRAYWKIARIRVMWALKKIQDAHQEHQRLISSVKISNLRFVRTHSLVKDAATMVEVYHTVLNAARASYKQMYEAHAVPEAPFRLLMDCLEFQEEAIDGELSADRMLGVGSEALGDLAGAPHEQQMESCFLVAWRHLVEEVNGKCSKARTGWFGRVRRSCFFQGEWWVMQRDVVAMLAFIMTHESILEEVHVIQDFHEQVKKPIQHLVEQAKVGVLYQLMLKNPAMFSLFVHLLWLRLMLDFQQRLFKDLVSDGLLNEEDAEHIIQRVIEPIVYSLDNFAPTREQLRVARRGAEARRRSWPSMSAEPMVRVNPDPGDFQSVVTKPR